MYDPSKIDTNMLDVNFQNKINCSADQYFEGKMFDQNYSIEEKDLPNNNNNNYQNEKKDKILENKNSDSILLNKENDDSNSNTNRRRTS